MNRKQKNVLFAASFLTASLLLAGVAAAQAAPPKPAPFLRREGGRTRLIVDGQPFLMLTAEANNSSGSGLEFMQNSWKKYNAIHANTAVVSLSWELIEPQEGVYDFRTVDGLIAGARAHNLRLVFLWFGTWKNTFSSYVPAWVKTDRTRFLFAQPTPGEKHWGAISAWSDAGRDADARAFAAVMRHLRQVDGTRHTVLMMQVENETGLIGGSRDHVPAAEADFARPIPTALGEYLKAHQASLLPELRDPWQAAGARTAGTWTEVFGTVADEAFMAWHYGRYVDAIAAAGKREYPLPMFVNAWLEGEPGSYPNGGPVSRMGDVWRVAAPHIDLLAPDIYGDTRRFSEMSTLYTRAGNPLLVVESSADHAVANAWTAFATFGALGFGPYPLEEPFDPAPVGDVYQCLAGMMPQLIRYGGTDRMVGILLDRDEPQEFDLNGYRLVASPLKPKPDAKQTDVHPQPGHGLVLALGPDEFAVVGTGFSLQVNALPGRPGHVEVLSCDEGRFVNGEWVAGRRLNGDEYESALTLSDTEPGVTGLRRTIQGRRVRVWSSP